MSSESSSFQGIGARAQFIDHWVADQVRFQGDIHTFISDVNQYVRTRQTFSNESVRVCLRSLDRLSTVNEEATMCLALLIVDKITLVAGRTLGLFQTEEQRQNTIEQLFLRAAQQGAPNAPQALFQFYCTNGPIRNARIVFQGASEEQKEFMVQYLNGARSEIAETLRQELRAGPSCCVII